MEPTDKRILAFRKAINDWKRETFFPELVEENDSESIDRRIDEARDMYEKLMRKIVAEEKRLGLGLKPQKGGGDAITTILATLGPEEKWTEPLLDQVRSSLITDLIEYPLTFNPTLIDQFKEQPKFPTFE